MDPGEEIGAWRIEPVALLRTCFGGKFGVPRQPGLCPSAWGRLEFLPPYRSREMLRGLEGFSHLWLVFGFHRTLARGWRPTVRPPRLGGETRVGVFASRSTHRPNGLGLSLVTLERVDLEAAGGPHLHLGGVDLVDGTPVFDLKPYLPYAEAPPGARAAYAGEPPPRLEVTVDEAAAADFARLPARARAVLREALALDPRPAARPAGDGAERVFGAELCGCDVRFTISPEGCRIVEIRHGAGGGLAEA